VGRGLHELAAESRADLLVVGVTGHGQLGRLLIGDDTRATLDRAPCPVAIAPAGYSLGTQTIRNVGVAYDGSPESRYAAQVARQLALRFDAQLSALRVVTLPSDAVVDSTHYVGSATEDGTGDARGRGGQLAELDTHTIYGDPSELLARYSESVDLLVVGSRGYGPIGRFVHGSTSQRLARTARRPLLVLTCPAVTGRHEPEPALTTQAASDYA
jgi:nucleotide-binding universal stress UspA family protein